MLRTKLEELDAAIARLSKLPTPANIRDTVGITRDLFALVVQAIEELESRAELADEQAPPAALIDDGHGCARN